MKTSVGAQLISRQDVQLQPRMLQHPLSLEQRSILLCKHLTSGLKWNVLAKVKTQGGKAPRTLRESFTTDRRRESFAKDVRRLMYRSLFMTFIIYLYIVHILAFTACI